MAGKMSSLQMSFWTGVNPEWAGRISSLQMSLGTGMSHVWERKLRSLQMSLWTGMSSEWVGRVSNLQMFSQKSVWTSNPMWVILVEKLSVMETLAYVSWGRGKKTSVWTAYSVWGISVERKRPGGRVRVYRPQQRKENFWTSKLVRDAKNKKACLRVQVNSREV